MAHVYHAFESGLFMDAGLNVEMVEVHSSDEQMHLWDSGELTVMHTSPDHLLRDRAREPVALRAESIGELVLYRRPVATNTAARWGVDDADSAFALVLRRLLDAHGIPWTEEQLVSVGGTRQRWHAMKAGDIDGAVLHTPFSRQAEADGFIRVAGHRECVPLLITTTIVAARNDAASPPTLQYLEVLERSREALRQGGASSIAQTLERRGWAASDAATASVPVLEQFAESTTADLTAGLQQVVALRQRYVEGWVPPRSPAAMVGRA